MLQDSSYPCTPSVEVHFELSTPQPYSRNLLKDSPLCCFPSHGPSEHQGKDFEAVDLLLINMHGGVQEKDDLTARL